MTDDKLEQICNDVLNIYAEYSERDILTSVVLEPESAKAAEIRARKVQLDQAKEQFMAEIKSGDAGRKERAVNTLRRPARA